MLRIIARIGFLLGTLLFAAFFAKSQTYGIPINGLKKVYPNEDVIVYRSKVVYTVDFNKYNVPNAIIEKTEDKYVALQPESHAVDARYYNMYSEISKHRVSGTGIFNPSTSQRCGDYETDGIFYHDAKVCEFYLRFKKAGEYLTVKTTKKYNDPKYFTKILFNQVYAIKYKTVRLELPINIDIELLEMNLEPYDIIKTELIDENSQLKIIEYKISDIPSSHKLENIPGYSCTFPHLLVLFKGYEKSDGQVGLIENTDDLYNWYKSLITEPTLSPELAAITDQLAPADIPLAKMINVK